MQDLIDQLEREYSGTCISELSDKDVSFLKRQFGESDWIQTSVRYLGMKNDLSNDIIDVRSRIKLLTCPCCGGTPEVYEQFIKMSICESFPELTELRKHFYVRCLGCCMESGRVSKSTTAAEELQAQWNMTANRVPA